MAAPAIRIPGARSSPAIRAFELNPFRILRLDANISTTNAANQAENALTLERVGLELADPDPLSWLALAGSYELQQAAQIMEEPLVRLKHQMLWFDLVRDSSAPLLRDAIRDLQSDALKQYLGTSAVLPQVGEAALADDSVGGVVEVELTDAAPANDSCPACGAPLSSQEMRCASCGATWDIIDEAHEDAGQQAKPANRPANADGAKGADLKYDVDVNFWEAIRGTTPTLKITYHDECPRCDGTGKAPGQTTQCPSCKGGAKAMRTCLRCDGSGRLPVNCTECSGRKRRERTEEVDVRIPAGIQPGMAIRLPGKGEAGGKGGPPGDLYVAVKVGSDDFYGREGPNLHIQIPLSPTEVASGVEMDIPALDGVVRMRFPQGTKSGQKFRLAGKGVWDIHRKRVGALYVEGIVISSEQKLSQLRRNVENRVRSAKAPSAERPVEAERKFARRLDKPLDPQLMARAVNEANLLLLVGAAAIDGISQKPLNLTAELKAIPAKKWTALNGFQRLENPHLLLAGTADGTKPYSGDVDGFWRRGLQQWTRILAHPWFEPYVTLCIADLGDDYVSADDVEAVVESVRTQLVDLSAQEARYLLLEGRYETAGAIISAMADSGMDARVLTPAARPLRNVFQSEISELETLFEQPGESVTTLVDAYLKRLDSIKERWMRLDGKGVVGLRDLLDQAAEKAYLKLRNVDRKDKALDGLLERIKMTASATSLKERVSSFQAELVQDRQLMCQFCKTERPNFERSVVLKGKKVTGVTYSGNTRTTHYLLRNMPMLRCDRCAKLHDYVLTIEKIAAFFVVGFPAAVLLLYGGVGALFAGGIFTLVLGWIFIYGVIWVITRIIRASVAGALTPSDHRKIGEVDDAEGTLALQREGFGVTPDFSINAIAKIKK